MGRTSSFLRLLAGGGSMNARFSVLCALLMAWFIGGCGGDSEKKSGLGSDSSLRIAIGSEPPSLDPGLLTDVVSANVVLNFMDPLVRLNDDLEPEPALAEGWEFSGDDKTVTFMLREDGRWTNGDPVTAA